MSTYIRLKVELIDETNGGVQNGTPRKEWVTVLAVAEQCEAMLNTVWRKAQMYGPAWREQGYMGNLARIMSKTSRLKNMLWRNMALESSEEPVTDTAQDLMALTAMFLANRQENNGWGDR